MSAMQFGKTDINIQNKIHTMKMTKTKLAKGFTLVELLVVIAIIAALAALSTPVVLKQQKKASLAQGVNNAKQISYLMKDFEEQNGVYPTVDASDGYGAAATSDLIFKKFYAAGNWDGDEEVFHAKTPFTIKPDGDEGAVPATDALCLAPGECGFGYSAGLSSSNNASLPLVYAPLLTTAAMTFDTQSWGGSGCYLEISGAVKTVGINGVDNQLKVTRAAASRISAVGYKISFFN